jgi:hypothetical protein
VKTRIRAAAISLLMTLCLMVMVVPASAGDNLYDNGPVNGQVDAWTISRDMTGFTYNYYVSNAFSLASGGPYNVTGFDFWAWLVPGDAVTQLNWEISDSPFNGSLGLGTACLSGGSCNGTISNTDTFTNGYGYVLDFVQVSGIHLGSNLPAGQYFLTLESGLTNTGDPVFWDQNNGVGCTGDDGAGGGCGNPGQQNGTGTIPSEAFTIEGNSSGSTGTTPEPSSLVLFGSGMLGVAAAIRRKLSA